MSQTATEKTAPAKGTEPAQSAPYDYAAAASAVKSAPMPPGTRGAPNQLDATVERLVDAGPQVIEGLPSEEIAEDARRMIRSAANRRKWGSSVRIKATKGGMFNVHFAVTSKRKQTGAKTS